VEDAGLELVGEAARQQLEHHIAHPHLANVSIRQHTSAYVSIRQHTPAYVRQELEHHIAHPHRQLRRASPVALVCRRNASRRQVAHVSARLRLVRVRLQLLAAAHKQPHKRPAVACAHGACSPESEKKRKIKEKEKEGQKMSRLQIGHPSATDSFSAATASTPRIAQYVH
jgi:hypothetical protein